MCTAIYNNNGILGRTVDRTGALNEHFVFSGDGIVGGVIRNSYGEVWIDGMNTCGVMAALLNYRRENRERFCDRREVSPAVLVREILENCSDVGEAEALLSGIGLSDDEPRMYPHYIICDSGRCIVYENRKIYENPLGVLANAPSFGEMLALRDRVKAGEKIIWDHTSESRFLRMAHLCEKTHLDGIGDVYAALNLVSVPEGFDPRENYRTVLRNVMSATDGLYCTADGCAGCVRVVKSGKKGVFSLEECEILTLS